MMRFYSQGFLKVLLKTTILRILYTLLLGVTMFGMMVFTIMRM